MSERKTPWWRADWFTCTVALLVALALIACPVGATWMRLLLIVAFTGAIALGIKLLWKWKKLRIAALVFVAIPVVFASIPGRTQNAEKLQADYVEALLRWENAPYVWGGETRWGVDCSGLVRQALIEAHLKRALVSVNPSHFRSALGLWWHDCTAQALSDHYRSYTVTVSSADSVNAITSDQLRPGDIAVTQDGVHVLAYATGGRWVEADPGLRKVLVVKTPDKENPWFNTPVKILRWTALITSPSD